MPGARHLALVLMCFLLPAIGGLPSVARAAVPAQQAPASVPLYGIPGHFEILRGQTFAAVFVAADGLRLTAAGSDATIQQQIEVLASQSPARRVAAWGIRNFDPKPSYTPDFVVSEILPEGDQALPAEVDASTVSAVVNYGPANLYSTPSQSMSVVAQAQAGEQCTVQGRDAAGAWLLLDCGGKRGWIARRLVNGTGSIDRVPVTDSIAAPEPPSGPLQPVPTPQVFTPPAPRPDAWRALYYNNSLLSGSPVAYQDIAATNIDLNWAYGSPAPAVPVDYFSATFERTYSFPQRYYIFTALANDGVRLYIDNDLVINEWHRASDLTYTAVRLLSGVHHIRVEYLELIEAASIRFTISVSDTPPPWQATYYEGGAGRGAQRAAQLEMDGPGARQLDRTWGNDSPFPGLLPADGWNGRWEGRFVFTGGNYVFRARAQDGVRVYLNGQRVIDEWTDGPHDRSNTFRNVGPGTHTITVDFYNRYGYAYLLVYWYVDQSGPVYAP